MLRLQPDGVMMSTSRLRLNSYRWNDAVVTNLVPGVEMNTETNALDATRGRTTPTPEAHPPWRTVAAGYCMARGFLEDLSVTPLASTHGLPGSRPVRFLNDPPDDALPREKVGSNDYPWNRKFRPWRPTGGLISALHPDLPHFYQIHEGTAQEWAFLATNQNQNRNQNWNWNRNWNRNQIRVPIPG